MYKKIKDVYNQINFDKNLEQESLSKILCNDKIAAKFHIKFHKKTIAILIAAVITITGAVTAAAFHSRNKELVAKYLGESAVEKSGVDDSQVPVDISENEHIKATANLVFNDANLFYILISFDGKDKLGKKVLNSECYSVIVYEDDEEHTQISNGGTIESDKLPNEGKGDMLINILDTPSSDNLILEFDNEPITPDESNAVKENVFDGIKLKISSKPNIKPAKFECKEGLVLELSKISMSIYVSEIDKRPNSEEIREAIDKIEDTHLLLPYECKLIDKEGKESNFIKIDPQHFCTLGSRNSSSFFKCYSLDFLDLSDIEKIIINGVEFNKTK